MKAKTLIILAVCAALPMMSWAAKPKKNAAAEPVAEEEPEIVTEDCVMYTSLFHESAKNKQYADALEPWLNVYKTCPSYSKNVYVDGDKIVEWKISQCAVGSAEYKEWRDLLLTLHDKRIKYFGNDSKYPAAYILGQKALDYCVFFSEDNLKETAYPWFKESIIGMGNKAQVSVVMKFAEVSLGLYKSNPAKYGEQYITDYQLAADVLSAQANDAANKNAAAAASNKDYLDNVFAASGAADCDQLDKINAAKVNSNLQNLDELNKVIKLYRSVGCVESDVYFAAAEASHKLAPTAESAAGCAAMCKKKGDWKGAVEYYDQATDLSDVDQDRADYQYNAAMVLYQELKNYQQSRTYLRRSLEFNPNQGRCYMLMGILYASSKPYSEAEYGAKAAILNKTVFWVAVDKLIKAKQVEPEVAESVNSLISTYAKYFPTKEERFDLPGEFSGSTFTVGGWIGETTTIR